MSTEPDRPMPDHQLEAFRRDPYDCVAGEVIQLVREIDRLRAENAELRAEVNQLTAERDDLYDTIGTNADAAASRAAYEGWLSGRNGVDRG